MALQPSQNTGPTSPKPPPEAFAAARIGISLVRWGVVLFWAFGFFAIAGWFASIVFNDSRIGKGPNSLAMIALPFQLVSGLIVLLGVGFSCWVPKGCGAVKSARCVIAALATSVPLSLFIASAVIAGQRFNHQSAPTWLDATATVASSLLSIAVISGSLCYFLLLTALAQCFGHWKLASRFILVYLGELFAFFGVIIGGGLIAAAAGPYSSSTVDVRLLLAVVCGVWLIIEMALSIWLLILLTRLHRLMAVSPELEPGRFSR
jgi:hypothetical protein